MRKLAWWLYMYKNRLKEIRESANLTQKSIADILNLSKSQYSNYETEYATMPIKYLSNLCDYFDVSLDFIFELSNQKTYDDSQNMIDKLKSGKRLKEFRKEYKITQRKLANILNTTFTTISSYECGINIINTNYLYAICKKYNISADYLLGKIDSPKYLNN